MGASNIKSSHSLPFQPKEIKAEITSEVSTSLSYKGNVANAVGLNPKTDLNPLSKQKD